MSIVSHTSENCYNQLVLTMNDLEAVYTIVLRNLVPYQYAELLPEAQEAMLREAKTLKHFCELSETQKRKLANSLRLLANRFGDWGLGFGDWEFSSTQSPLKITNQPD